MTSQVLDEVGFDRLTTSMVAEGAGVAIGTLYRYFPDRIVLLKALHDREIRRLQDRIVDQLASAPVSEIWQAVDVAVTVFVDMFRNEPGFRIVRFVDVKREPPMERDDPQVGYIARWLAEVLSKTFQIAIDAELIFNLEVVVQTTGALVHHAFVLTPGGDPRFIRKARAINRLHLEEAYGSGSGSGSGSICARRNGSTTRLPDQ
ncbi:MAG: TetR/AcrR family transcriptional regulator [Microbacteriaceae bacterium]